MAIYLKIPNVNGDVSTQNFKQWIAVNDIEFSGINKPITLRVGETMDRNTSFPTFSHITFLKHFDTSSTALFQAAHTSETFDKVEFNFVSSGNNPTVYGKLILHNVVVTHYGNKHSAEAVRPKELITLAYTQIEQTFIPHDNNNKTGSPLITGYDLEKAKKL